ncbi:MAG: TRAP transporter small permease [Alphaproteobacteria bacterium]|nr:TRAP transporter small permease [Alphaproteobacteria bacterium]
MNSSRRSDLPSAMRRVSQVLAWIAGAIILFGSAVPISIDVVSRLFLNRTLVASFEISGYALAACIGLGMGYTVTTKANIRIDFLTAKLPTALRRLFDLIAAVSLALVAGALAWFSFGVVQQSWSMGAKSISTLQVPLVLPQGIWWVGLFWFATVAVLTPIVAIHRYMRGQSEDADALLASTNLSEEMERAGVDDGDRL